MRLKTKKTFYPDMWSLLSSRDELIGSSCFSLLVGFQGPDDYWRLTPQIVRTEVNGGKTSTITVMTNALSTYILPTDAYGVLPSGQVVLDRYNQNLGDLAFKCAAHDVFTALQILKKTGN